jgi:hypothetical protein
LVLVLELSTHDEDLTVGSNGCDRLTDEKEFSLRMLHFSIIFIGQKMHGVFDEAFLEYVRGKFLFLFILIAIFVRYFFFVVPHKVIEVYNHERVRLKTSLCNQVVVLYLKVRTPRNKFSYTITYRLDPHCDLASISSTEFARVDCPLFY